MRQTVSHKRIQSHINLADNWYKRAKTKKKTESRRSNGKGAASGGRRETSGNYWAAKMALHSMQRSSSRGNREERIFSNIHKLKYIRTRLFQCNVTGKKENFHCIIIFTEHLTECICVFGASCASTYCTLHRALNINSTNYQNYMYECIVERE